MTQIRLLWFSASGPQDQRFPTSFFGAGNFAEAASVWAKAKFAAEPPTSCVTMFWCSNGEAKAEAICPQQGESDFAGRAAQWIKDRLTELPATNECVPPYP